MEYFAGLDVSMKETHVCVVDREGGIVLETSTATLPEVIAAALTRAPDCQRVALETGRMAPTLYLVWRLWVCRWCASRADKPIWR